MVDTHCHLNFSAFKKNLQETVEAACSAGVHSIIIPGTDVKNSRRAVEIASSYEGIYVAVGIHPHHVYELKSKIQDSGFKNELKELELLLEHEKVIAVGEVGIDRYVYTQTKYKEYSIDEDFVTLQKEMFAQQIQMALRYDKSLIIHNRLAKADLFEVLGGHWDKKLEGRAVLHCCEPDADLLSWAKDHDIYLGIDGDITYSTEKQEFIKHVGAEEFCRRYVLETDAPFLLPEPLRTQKKYPNKPEHIQVITNFIADLLNIDAQIIKDRTTENAQTLFLLPQK